MTGLDWISTWLCFAGIYDFAEPTALSVVSPAGVLSFVVVPSVVSPVPSAPTRVCFALRFCSLLESGFS